jgi:hypothetical protein
MEGSTGPPLSQICALLALGAVLTAPTSVRTALIRQPKRRALRSPISFGRRNVVRLERLAVGRSQPFRRHVVHQGAEPRTLVPLCCFSHSLERTGRAGPALVKPRARSIRDSRLRFSNYRAFRRTSEVGVAYPNLKWVSHILVGSAFRATVASGSTPPRST